MVKQIWQVTHRDLGLWEIRTASKPKFGLQKEKANTSGKRHRQRKRGKAGSSNTTGSQEWTTSYIWTTNVLQRSRRYGETPICKHTPRQTAGTQPSHTTTAPSTIYFGPVQDITIRAGNKVKEAKEKYTQYLCQRMHQKVINGAGWTDLHTGMNNKLHPREGRPWMTGLTSIWGANHGPPCLLALQPPWLLWLVVSAQAAGKREGKLLERKEGHKPPFEAQFSAFWHPLMLLCQDGQRMAHAGLNATQTGLPSLPSTHSSCNGKILILTTEKWNPKCLTFKVFPKDTWRKSWRNCHLVTINRLGTRVTARNRNLDSGFIQMEEIPAEEDTPPARN